jgi:hypothetical protein
MPDNPHSATGSLSLLLVRDSILLSFILPAGDVFCPPAMKRPSQRAIEISPIIDFSHILKYRTHK